MEETWRLCDAPRLEAVGEERLRQLETHNQTGMEWTPANFKKLLEASS